MSEPTSKKKAASPTGEKPGGATGSPGKSKKEKPGSPKTPKTSKTPKKKGDDKPTKDGDKKPKPGKKGEKGKKPAAVDDKKKKKKPGTIDDPLDLPPDPMTPVPTAGAPASPAYEPRESKVAAHLRSIRGQSTCDMKTDPRTGLALMSAPPNYANTFKGFSESAGMDQYLLHNFEEVRAEGSPPGSSPVDRILLVTDQTLYLCDRHDSNIAYATQVAKISKIEYDSVTSKIAIVTPTADAVMELSGGPVARTNIIKNLSQIYSRATNGKTLEVHEVQPIDPTRYNYPGEGYVPENNLQRTKGHMKAAFDKLEEQEAETLKWVEELQNELESEHAEDLRRKDMHMSEIMERVKESERVQDAQNQEILRLQKYHQVATMQEADIDLEGMDPKDKKIYLLESTLKQLREATAKRLDADDDARMAGTFFERDLSHEVKQDPTRPRGGSLHVQGLVEVLQQQVVDRNTDIESLRAQLEEMDDLKSDIKRKDATIKALMLQAQTAGGIAADSEIPRGAAGLSSHSPHPAGPSDAFPFHFSAPQYGPGSEAPGYGGTPGTSPRSRGHSLAHLPPPQSQQAPPQKTISQTQPFATRLPNHPSQLSVNPINGLKLLDVPPEYGSYDFKDLTNTVLHYFEKVLKCGRKGRGHKDPRVLVITDNCIYLCNVKGLINRCVSVANVREILIDDEGGLGFRIADADNFDMLYEVSIEKQQEAIRVLHAIQRAKNKPPAKVTKYSTPISKGDLNLNRPPKFAPKLKGVTTKAALLTSLKEAERAQYDRNPTVVTVPDPTAQPHQPSQNADAHAAYTRHAVEALKEDLRSEFQAKKDLEYQRLKQRIQGLESENDKKLAEIAQLKAYHKKRAQGENMYPNIPARHTEGMYWIPTEPILLEGHLEVLKIQFWDNILITSHANGFLNIWDINTAELIRTLKDHTAKVIAFQYDGVELVSGSFDSTIRRWNVSDGTCLNVIQAHKGQVTCLQFDRNILVSGASDSTIQVWQMDIELRNIRTLRGHKSSVTCLRFERNVLVSAEWGWIFVWDLNKGLVTKALRDEQGGILCLDFGDQYLLTGGHAGALTMWDVETGEYETLEGHTDDINHIQLEGSYAVTSGADCTIRMWNLVNFKSLGVFNNSYPHECNSFQFIANRFAAAEHKTVKVWTK